ncbi:MAG: amidase, partial [Firmicutes bacterium]|nr:amidase [Bacillota bacterium]
MQPFTTIRQLQLEVRAHPDLAETVLRRARSLVEAWEPWIRAFVYLDWTLAEQNLKEASPLGWLWPAPIGIKDLADVRDMPTTGSSRAYHWVAEADAPAVARLREAGAVILGKTNTQELAYGVITPPTRNPWNLEHIPGGSSGGTAAAVAAGVIPAGLGTDTGGSIRIPASCCGVVGFKPGYGRIPLDGIMPLAPTLDHVGPITRTVEEAAWCYRIMAGEPDPLRPLKGALGWQRLGVPWEYIEQAMAPPVASNFRDCLHLLKELGFALEPFALDPWPNWMAVQMAIRGPESYRVHREVLTGPRRGLLSADLVARLEQGQHVAGADYLEGLATRQAWIRRYREQFARLRLDAVVMPTLP